MEDHVQPMSNEGIDRYWESYQHNNGSHQPIEQNTDCHYPAEEMYWPVNEETRDASSASKLTKYPQHYNLPVHGNNAALQFKPDVTKRSFFTVRIESAPKIPNSKSYNWQQKKVSIQFTETELLDVIAVFLGYKVSCNYKSHGTENNKGFEIQYQSDRKSFYVSVMGPGAKNSVAVPFLRGMQIGHLCLSIYVDNFPGLTTDTVISNLIRMAQLNNN